MRLVYCDAIYPIGPILLIYHEPGEYPSGAAQLEDPAGISDVLPAMSYWYRMLGPMTVLGG
jgi:hypothetical protein